MTTPSDKTDKNGNVAAVEKTFAILTAIGKANRIGVSELAEQIQQSKTTVHRLLQTLKQLGYVNQDPQTEHYHLTIRLFELGARALENTDLIKEADIEMRKIAEATRETVHLGALDEDMIIYIHKIDSEYGLRMASRIGRRNPLYSTAIGKILLAYMPEAEANKLLAHIHFTPSTAKTLANAQAVLNILPKIREQGYSEDNEEQEEGLVCIAVPVFDRFGRVIAGLSLSFPTLRCGADTKTHYIKLLKDGAAAISSRIGYNPEA